MVKICISDLVRRQTGWSRFSYFGGTDAELLDRIHANFDNAVQGYRDGVLLVPIPDTSRFYSATCTLKSGDVLKGTYRPRKEGEAPRKQIGVAGGQKIPAKRVDIVLYRYDVLAENHENSKRPCLLCSGSGESIHHRYGCSSCSGTGKGTEAVDADWEVISINCTATDQAEPMSVGTLLANHFHVEGSNDGGTTTRLSDQDLIQKLRESYEYWKDKAMVAE